MRSVFDILVDEIIDIEGGYVNDPADLGGETNLGISRHRYPNEDIANMTIARAKYLYKKDFWEKYDIGRFAVKYQGILFDMYVNHSPKTVTTIVQKAINNKLGDERGLYNVVVDGKWGPQTEEWFVKSRVEPVRILAYRASYYSWRRIRASQNKFFFGWMNNRVFRFIREQEEE